MLELAQICGDKVDILPINLGNRAVKFYSLSFFNRLFRSLDVGFTPLPRDLQPKCKWIRAQTLDQNSREIHKLELPEICGQQDVRAQPETYTGQNADKGRTPDSRFQDKNENF